MSARDDVDDAVDDSDHLARRASAKQLHDPRIGERERAEVGLGCPGVHLEFTTKLAVDRDRYSRS